MTAADFRLHTRRGRVARSFLARRGQVLVDLDEQGREDLALIRRTRAMTPLLLRDAAALTLLAWVRSTARLGGELAEAGVFAGGSARLICTAKGEAPLHLFDMFGTEPHDVPLAAAGRIVRDYFDGVQVPLAQVEDLLSGYRGVHFHPGLFPASAQAVSDRRFSFVHLDLDLAEGTADALAFFYPRLLPGGVIVGDDYTFAPVRQAFTAFFAGKPVACAALPWGQVVVVKAGS